MNLTKTTLKECLAIKRLVSLHYFEFAKDFVFEGEKHDFWELVYVDKGEAEVVADTTGYNLKQGDIIFHQPNEFHSIWANKKIAPNIIVVSFVCKSPSASYFAGKIFSLRDQERDLLANIVKEGFNAFLPPFNSPSINTLRRKQDVQFGSEHLIKIYLESLLIRIVRKGNLLQRGNRQSTVAKERIETDAVKRITEYMKENIFFNLTIKQICTYSNIGRTQLILMFKEKTGLGVIEYFKNLKIECAKVYIREERFNFTEIAEKFGYSSIHCFSRHFKKVTDMSPSEYGRSVKARVSIT